MTPLPRVLTPKTLRGCPILHERSHSKQLLSRNSKGVPYSRKTRRLLVCRASSSAESSPLQIGEGYMRDARVGVLGGGQLGRMMALAAANMGVSVSVLDPADPAPASVAAKQVVGSFTDAEAIKNFVTNEVIDVLTVEIEHVNVDALEEVQDELGTDIQPTPSTLRIIQDKFAQKEFFEENDIAVVDFMDIPDQDSMQEAAEAAGQEFGYPFMLKTKRLAYDGRGNAQVASSSDLESAVEQLGGYSMGLYAERWAPFAKELAIMVARSTSGDIKSYPVTQTIHSESILSLTETPADVPPDVAEAARELARDAVSCLSGAGIFGVEMFLLPGGGVAINEVAPRPHNSGHYTMAACPTSQFEQHLRAVLGWPLGEGHQLPGSAIMLNLLGTDSGASGLNAAHTTMTRAYGTPGASVHWYCKASVEPRRKIGHINIVGPTRAEARRRLEEVEPAAAQALGGAQEVAPEVAIIMGSDSDLPTMTLAAQVLKDFHVPCEVTVVSAHRTPERMFEFARTAHSRGVKVIIAGAGGAAHLPGMVAALTPLPVIGVPVVPANAHLGGLDALASIVQMPRGVPVATVAIGNATNAGLLAVRILAATRPALLRSMVNFANIQKETVEGKAEVLEEAGWQAYLSQMKSRKQDKKSSDR